MVRSEYEHDQQSYEIKYPILMRSVMTGTIILFYSEKAGVVMHSGKSIDPPGKWSDNWHPASDSKQWQPLKGDVTLHN